MCGYFLILSEPAKKCQYLFIMFPSVLMEQLIISGPVPLECCFVFIGGVLNLKILGMTGLEEKEDQ